jgi:signal peptidase I
MTEATLSPAALTEGERVPSRRRRVLRWFWRFTVALFAIIGFVTVVRPLLFDLTPLASGSMAPTLQGDSHGGDWVLAEKVSYRFRSPRRWEVVEFNDEEGIQIMKRVVALPGETVAIQNNRLQVNGQAADPPAGTARVKYYAYGNLMGGKAHPVGDGYYVLGDDSIDSQDSRFDGSVTASRVRARAWFIVWPPSRMRWVR